MTELEQLLDLVKEKYPLRACDPGTFTVMRASGMRFTLEAYEAEGLGHISLMQAKGFFGLMQMHTLIVNPTERDLPLYSYDRILAMGNDTLIAELCDTVVSNFDPPELNAVVSAAAGLPDRDPGVHWYDSLRLPQSISKKGTKKQSAALDKLALAHFSAWLSAETAPLTDRETKREKTKAYVEGLLTHGGPSTDAFIKAIGKEKTEELYRKVLFGTE